MKVVGLTGGIGSGKTTVSHFFAALGIPIYIADVEAKRLTNTSKVIRRKLIALLGEEAYTNAGINRAFVANIIFNDTHLLQKVNDIIHPRVGQDFRRWLKKQKGPYCIKEAAVLFENGGYKECDAVILVTAPEDVRLARVIGRDKTTKEAVEARMANQWSDDKKVPLSTYIIENTDLVQTQLRVAEIHKALVAAE